MARRDFNDWTLGSDGVGAALEHLMPRSAGAIVREAFYGTARFDELLTRTNLTRSVLSTQLERLTRLEVLQRVPYQLEGERQRWEYRLTRRGLELGSAFVALIDWAERWLPSDRSAIVPVHENCGAQVHTALTCDAGHLHIDIAEIEAAVRPAVAPPVQQ